MCLRDRAATVIQAAARAAAKMHYDGNCWYGLAPREFLALARRCTARIADLPDEAILAFDDTEFDECPERLIEAQCDLGHGDFEELVAWRATWRNAYRRAGVRWLAAQRRATRARLVVEYAPSAFFGRGWPAVDDMLGRLALLDKDTMDVWASRVNTYARVIQRVWRSRRGSETMPPPPARRKASSARQAARRKASGKLAARVQQGVVAGVRQHARGPRLEPVGEA